MDYRQNNAEYHPGTAFLGTLRGLGLEQIKTGFTGRNFILSHLNKHMERQKRKLTERSAVVYL